MPVVERAFVSRRTLSAAEQQVAWEQTNQHILVKRQEVEQTLAGYAGKIGMLAGFGIEPTTLVRELADYLARLLEDTYEFGRRSAKRELADLRASRPPPPEQLQLGATRKDDPSLHATEVRRRAESAAADVADAADDYIASAPGDAVGAARASNTALHLQVLQMIGSSLNLGRTRGASEAVGGPPRYAMRSEQLDKNTCDACSVLHGTIVVIDSLEYFQILPPEGCYGRGRCRGVMVFGDGPGDVTVPPDDLPPDVLEVQPFEMPPPDLEALKAEVTSAGNRISGLKTQLKRNPDAAKTAELNTRLKFENDLREHLKAQIAGTSNQVTHADFLKAQITSTNNRLSGLKTRLKKAATEQQRAELDTRIAYQMKFRSELQVKLDELGGKMPRLPKPEVPAPPRAPTPPPIPPRAPPAPRVPGPVSDEAAQTWVTDGAGVNMWLRGEREVAKEMDSTLTVARVKKLTTEIDKGMTETVADQEVWRGSTAWRETFGLKYNEGPEALLGREAVEKGYTSTTRSREMADLFGDGEVSFRIKVPGGTKALDIGKLNEQEELLLARGLKLRVTNVTRDFTAGERWVVTLEVVPKVPKVARVPRAPKAAPRPRVAKDDTLTSKLAFEQTVTTRSLTYDRAEEVLAEMKAASAEIDKLLRLPSKSWERGTLPARAKKLGGGVGAHIMHYGTTPGYIEVNTVRSVAGAGADFAHEVGHLVDLVFTLGPRGSGFAVNRGSVAMADEFKRFFSAVDASRAGMRLRESLRRSPRSEFNIYANSNEEVWARAFAQWVAKHSGDQRLMAQISGAADRFMFQGLQWQWDDWDEIDAAMTAIFRAAGLLR